MTPKNLYHVQLHVDMVVLADDEQGAEIVAYDNAVYHSQIIRDSVTGGVTRLKKKADIPYGWNRARPYSSDESDNNDERTCDELLDGAVYSELIDGE